MITRSNLEEQLREYQIRSKYEWTSVSFFSSMSNVPSRVDVVSVIWELLMFAFLVFSAVSLYFSNFELGELLGGSDGSRRSRGQNQNPSLWGIWCFLSFGDAYCTSNYC